MIPVRQGLVAQSFALRNVLNLLTDPTVERRVRLETFHLTFSLCYVCVILGCGLLHRPKYAHILTA